jgi:hypothetical protein
VLSVSVQAVAQNPGFVLSDKAALAQVLFRAMVISVAEKNRGSLHPGKRLRAGIQAFTGKT